MNKKGGFFLALIVSSMLFLVGMQLIPFFQDGVSDFRNNLDCTNTTISDGSKLTCLAGDIVVPYFILAILSFVGGMLANEI